MKALRNKKTGIIGELHFEPDKEYHFTVVTEDPADVMIYKKLATLYSEWEDYEDGPYFIDMWEDDCVCDARFGVELDVIERAKDCGLHFETREEAEKTVEKLKAWQRLKDKGFRFCGHDDRDRGQLGDIVIYAEMPTFEYDDDSTRDDLDLLFGGEE